MKRSDIDRAIKAASKKIKVMSDKNLMESLDYAVGGDACEAYRLGVEEAQGQIIQWLEDLKRELAVGKTSQEGK